jgi:hypothetical protein
MKFVNFAVTCRGSSPRQFLSPLEKHTGYALATFTPGEKAVGIHQIAVWVGLIVNLDMETKNEISSPDGN